MENRTIISAAVPVHSTAMTPATVLKGIGNEDLFASLLSGQMEGQTIEMDGDAQQLIPQPIIPWLPLNQDLSKGKLTTGVDQVISLLQNLPPVQAEAFVGMDEVQQWIAQASELLQNMQLQVQTNASPMEIGTASSSKGFEI